MAAAQNRHIDSKAWNRKMGHASWRSSSDGIQNQIPKGGFEGDERFFSNTRGLDAASLPHSGYQQNAVYQPVPPHYQQQGVIYPFWVPPYMLAQTYGPPAYWQPPVQPAGRSWYTNGAASLPLPEQQGMTGTGVFLPSNPGSEDGTANEQTCGESDGDSAESSADCLMLDEAAPIRRGQIESTTPIELLLPKEWEY